MSGRFETARKAKPPKPPREKKPRKKLQRPGWKTLLLLILNITLAALSVLCAARLTEYRNLLRTQEAADRWRGQSEERFAQVSVFLPVNETQDISAVRTFRQKLDQAMIDASLEAPEGGSLYQDAWSGTATSVAVSGPAGKSNVKTYGVGGDFFLFHPYTLLSGSYIAETDFAQDRVVLDENLAWQLFGSSDVAGMEVTIGERNYPVAGVVRLEDDKATKKALTDPALMFMSFDALNAIQETKFDTYEIVMPDPISGYALSVMKDKFPLGDGVAVENSNRYSALSLAKVALAYGERSMNTHAVIYPYWENAARLTEDYAALFLLLMVFFAITPAVFVLVWLIRTIKRLITEAKDKTVTAIEDEYARRHLSLLGKRRAPHRGLCRPLPAADGVLCNHAGRVRPRLADPDDQAPHHRGQGQDRHRH